MTITIKEYGAFCIGEKNGESKGGYITLTPKTFGDLESLILENTRDGEDSTIEMLNISARRGIGKVITAKNYVGIITMKDGTAIEILPKIYSDKYSDGTDGSTEEAKRALINMLHTLKDSPYKSLRSASVDIARMNLLEVFIGMFIDEVLSIVKRGLRSSYEIKEENVTSFKGRILFAQHIALNFIHKERVYAEFDEFSANRPENRIIKTALTYLSSHTRNSRNQKNIRNLLDAFDGVGLSTNIDADLSSIHPDRSTRDYTAALIWARVFLKGKSFTSFAGSNASLALLFPMDKLFESYVAALMRRRLSGGYSLAAQHTGYYLFDKPKGEFSIRPDIVITGRNNGEGESVYVMDTKWKMLSDSKPKLGLSQGDMYQMYVYQKKYSAQNVTLLYPASGEVANKHPVPYEAENGSVRVFVRFIDLSDAESTDRGIDKLLQEMLYADQSLSSRDTTEELRA